jgi:hyperosmotically inducible protein
MMKTLALLLSFLLLFPTMAALAQKKISDDQIYDEVRRKLANDPDVKGGAFEVTVKDGVVTVKGAVEKEKGRTKAERLVKKVKGVKSVVNQITVKTPQARK